MKITADANLLIRVFIEHEAEQSAAARVALQEASLVALTLPALCELVWVLGRSYKRSNAEIAAAIRALIDGENVVADHAAVEAGLAMLDLGGDFADGVIAHEGRKLGADSFVSFDREAVKLLSAKGEAAKLLA